MVLIWSNVDNYKSDEGEITKLMTIGMTTNNKNYSISYLLQDEKDINEIELFTETALKSMFEQYRKDAKKDNKEDKNALQK